jgi:hypothetical protein
VAVTRRVLTVWVAAGVLLAVAVGVTFAAFSATTSNPNDTFATGTVAITDNDAGGTMLSISSGKPGQPSGTSTGCIKVTYTGSLDSTVRLYATVAGTLAPYLQLTVTRGTDSAPSFASCTNFTADATNYIGQGAGVIFSGLLSAYPTNYAGGIVDPTSGSPETWTTNEAHSYKFVISLNNNSSAQGLSSTATFTWEARNQ